MRTHHISLLLLLISMSFSGKISAQSAEEKPVSAAVDKMRRAMIDADTVTLKALTSAVLSYGHSSGVVQSQAEFITAIGSGKSDFVSIDLTQQTIRMSGDVAIVRHVLSAVTNDSGVPGNVKLNILLIWQKQSKAWKLIARQAVKAPQG